MRGPDACLAEIVERLERDNPELLDMAAKCAADSGHPEKLMVGFAMFCQLLVVEAPTGTALMSPLPRVSLETRDVLVDELDWKGAESFTMEAISELEATNPELLQMAHGFASQFPDYLLVMQGFALLYRSLLVQSSLERRRIH